MAREPGKIVGYETDEVSKVKTPIRLLSDRMVFYARVGEATTENKDGDVVRKWVREQMKLVRNVTWTPIIIIEYESTGKPSAPHFNGRYLEAAIMGKIDFTARRTYAARMGQAARELDWKEHDEIQDPAARVDESYSLPYPAHVLENLPYRVKRRWKDDQIEIVFPYDENLWAGLVGIIQSIERSRVALKAILKDEGDAGAFLRLVGSGTFPVASLLPGQDTAAIVDDDSDPEEDDDR
jgi:hypothetical protein